jgi:hypothetical protein
MIRCRCSATFGGTPGFGPPTDYNDATGQNPEPPFANTYYAGKTYAMGGCMGCHGNAQVVDGADFSFILAGGPVQHPDTPTNADVVAATARYRALFEKK